MTSKTSFDFLVIGSGLAGTYAALRLARQGSVALVTKKSLKECNTVYAQGGISCVMSDINPADDLESHVRDTLEAGAGLCDEAVVRAILSRGQEAVRELVALGVRFTTRGDIDPDGSADDSRQYDLAREGGHSQRRILHAGDITGAELIRALSTAATECPAISIFEHHHAIDLITTGRLGWQDGHDQCLGAYILDVNGKKVRTFLAKATFLATGGAGKVYRYTTNPSIATGDGIAMAWRARAAVANMEFFQFHPTCLFHPVRNSFLISEAVRGEGAELKVCRREGEPEPFMQAYHPMGSLAPRDVVARAIDKELKETGQKCAWLDITHHSAATLQGRFPKIYAELANLGIHMERDLIPVVPAAHYCCGGVQTTVEGRSSIARLYALGETACTGLHGANRLASNSLLEAAVMAHAAAEDVAQLQISQTTLKLQYNAVPEWSSGLAKDADELVVVTQTWEEIRSFMWNFVGIYRTDKRLQRAKRRIRTIQEEINHYYWDFKLTPDLLELRNLACLAELIVDCAMLRQESRGLHYNLDHPVQASAPVDTVLRHD